MADGRGPAPVVVGNGAEGEPASEQGQVAAVVLPAPGPRRAAAGRRGGRLGRRPACTSTATRGCSARLDSAIAERAAAGLDAARVELIEAPHRFLAGEESALASRVSGGLALPRFKPPRASQRGVAGRRTLVQNVETLAHLALIARYGAAWFRSAGTADEPGQHAGHAAPGRRPDGRGGDHAGQPPSPTSCRCRRRPCWSAGTTARGCRPRRPNGCRWPTPRSARSARPSGPVCWPRCPGTGAASPRPPGWSATSRWNRRASAGRASTACRAWRAPSRNWPARGPARTAYADLERWSGLVAGRGACHHPDGTVRLVRSALRVFAAEIDQHAHGYCTGSSSQPFLPLPAETALDDDDWI